MNQTTMFDLDASPARYDDMPEPAPVARARKSDPPAIVGTLADEKKRTSTHRDQILKLLREGSVTNGELAAITPRYGARLHELKADHPWEKVVINQKTGLVVYRLKEGT